MISRLTNHLPPTLAEPGTLYDAGISPGWVDVLVDCPAVQGMFTYRLPPTLAVQVGDILSVPFGAQQVGAIAVRCHTEPPPDLRPDQIRDVESIVHPGFFPATYWSLLHQVAEYYLTPFMQVVKVALPPGLLARSQRRVRLVQVQENLINQENLLTSQPLSATAQQLLRLLQSSKTGDYSWQHLQRQVRGATRGLHELVHAGLVKSYLEPPAPPRTKQRQAVTLIAAGSTPLDLTPRQQEILRVLERHGGDVWLADLLQLCHTSSTTLKTLAAKGCLIIQPREVLRQEPTGAIAPDLPQCLTADQATALSTIQQLSGFAQVLLHGVTGAGKTEVYLQAIAPLLQRGHSALVLVPEIGLTPQLTDRFRARFGERVCVYHSALSEGERYDTWRQMLNGNPQVVIGTRSAVFAPLPHLGLIILDEEHDSSFKQDQPAPCYHARTVAQWRAELEECPLILGSATPSLESWVTIHDDISQSQGSIRESPGKNSKDAVAHPPTPPITAPSHYLSLPTRVHARPLPQIEVVDMRQELNQGNRSIFGRSLQAALQSLSTHNQQGILFIHRRGHSTFVSCRSCGYVVTCPNCDVSLAYHQPHETAVPWLRCHYCNYTQAVPSTCPSCDSIYFKHFGSGTQRVVQELTRDFPTLRVLRFDSDTTRTKGAHRSLLTRFAQGDADLLVGTQMLTKGIDLPQVTLVGIVAADGLLHLSDYRASERAYQTLTQVAGRCGRGDAPGRVILQTYTPDHAVIRAVQQQNYTAFVQEELHHRASLDYPPYRRLILLRFSSDDAIATQTAAERVAAILLPLEMMGVECLGPAPATIFRLNRRYRWQILLKLPLDVDMALPDLADLRAACSGKVSLTVDIDPVNFL